MVSGSRIEGGTQTLPARVRKTIQSLKEIVGNHSDADIYTTLKETNMDPNETAQKLLNQDPFREVKRRRDKKKENMGYRGPLDAQGHSEDVRQGTKVHTLSDRNARRGAYAKSSLPGISREFRIVRDNRVNRNTNREVKPAPPHLSMSTNEVSSNVPKSGPTGAQKPSGGRMPQVSFRKTDSHPSNQRDGYSTGIVQKEFKEDKGVTMSGSIPDMRTVKPNDIEQHSPVLASNSAAVGLYSSSTDPVHVPSPDSRSSAAVGAIKREVGAVGVRRQLKDHSINQSSGPSVSLNNSVSGRDGSSTDSFRPLSSISKGEHLSQITESVIPGLVGSRSTLNNQHASRQHQQTMGHQKASQPNKEWKPKSSQKSSTSNPGVIGTPKKSTYPGNESKDLASEAANLQDKLARVNIHENRNVIIAEHIRVPEIDRYQLIFGSFGTDSDSSGRPLSEFQVVRAPEELNGESSASQLASAPEISTDDVSSGRQVDLQDDPVRNSGSNSPDSGTASENQLADKRDSSSPQTLDTYVEIGLVRDRSPAYAPGSQHQDPTELPGFSAYDSQTGYDIPYFRPTVDETMRVQGLPSPQDAVNSHTANSIPASSIPMVQQQQTPVAQMYPQVHVSHFANLMPYRQFLSPVYVPPMAMPGYSSSAAYPHPSNGNSYLLMPGGSSHMNANNLKYGIQQFKPVPAGSPAGFGNFNNPAGYAINAPGVVGSATGLEDSSRIKYKDGNLYVPNAQAETSEIWIQNPRDLPGLQSSPYYNMPGQTPHGAYLPSHTGHASFSAGVAQSTHMQFPGMYHPSPQSAAIGNPHHLGPGMGGNVGVGVASATPGPQVSAFQQPQLGHLNWTTNF